MSGSSVTDIRSLSLPDLSVWMGEHGHPPFRARQIFRWLWKEGVMSFDAMTNLPFSLREQLKLSFNLPATTVHLIRESTDGTRKTVFLLSDGHVVEGVLIPTEDRSTACISTQVGCAQGCTFCATGQHGFSRNLQAAEMADQLQIIRQQSEQAYQRPLTNIVLMGMGEPLYNYQQVCRLISLLTDPSGWGMSPQRITLSTIGVPRMIRKMADDHIPVQLAVSLHAATNDLRSTLIPYNLRHPLEELSDALRYYHTQTGNRITIEYLLMREYNDQIEHAEALASFCRSFPVKINLIEYNPVPGNPYRRPEIRQIKAFRDFLESRNLVVNLRRSRGKDIDAACGQLAGNPDSIALQPVQPKTNQP